MPGGASMQREITFSGHDYISFSKGTAEHQMHAMALIKDCGLRDLVIAEGEDPRAFAARLMDQLISARLVFELIACWLVPANWEELIADLVEKGYEPSPGLAWTPARAEETAAILRRLTDDKEIADMQ